MTLAVVGSGFGRTGTKPLKEALEQIGFGPCHHMYEVMTHPEQVAHWQAAAYGKSMDWNTVFAGYVSQVDWPGTDVWRETVAAFPQAKVVHSLRPEADWWRSFSKTIAKLMASYHQMPIPPHVHDMMDAARTMIVDGTFGGHILDRETALTAYRLRTEQVRDAIAPNHLLVFDVSDG